MLHSPYPFSECTYVEECTTYVEECPKKQSLETFQLRGDLA